MKNTPKWFDEQDVQYTQDLYKITNQKIGDLYVEKYVKMMNEIHHTTFTVKEFKNLCSIY